MKLDTYIRTHDVTEAKLAEKAGCSQGTINKVRNGFGNWTFDILRRISEATDGEFTPGEFEPARIIGEARTAPWGSREVAE
jgi:transcriptional regulator with XRE-family HTH domain